MPVTVIVGEQRGDEGKGRFADMLADEHDIVARFNGGANAGHTVVLPDGRDFALHLLPSGIAHPHAVNVIGNGTVVDPIKLNIEIADASEKGVDIDEGNLMISSAAHLILPHHISLDELREVGSAKQGTTKSGIAPVYADKAMRSGVRMEVINNDIDRLVNIVASKIEETNEQRCAAGLDVIDVNEVTDRYITNAVLLGRFTTDTALYLNRRLKQGDRVLAEGAQAFLLDIDHGMYDAVTSSSTTVGGVMTGLGVSHQHIDRVIGVSKAVQSHVGGGPFATEITDEGVLERLHGRLDQVDSETGTTTGRKRRLGHLDLAAIKRAQMTNGTGEMVLTKLDWVSRYGETVLICTGYERKGKSLEVSPDAAYKIQQSTPQYTELPTWQQDISAIRDFGDLPPEAQRYVEFIEETVDVPVTMIGVGPRRDQVIVRT
ncbi:adenylosuccinate synthase [Candidatus Saccharibacteria bacterium]|nr:adenylosuccinate synthase [Candidatus Saccharibacteria bacterium]